MDVFLSAVVMVQLYIMFLREDYTYIVLVILRRGLTWKLSTSGQHQVDKISFNNGLQASSSVSLFPLRPMDTKYQFIVHQNETAAITIQLCNCLVCQQSYSSVYYGLNIHTFFDRRIFVPVLYPFCTICYIYS